MAKPNKVIRNIELLYEDEQLLAINKPPNWLSIPDRHDVTKLNLLTYLRDRYENVLTVHRLDKETSGAMVYARTEEAHRNLSQQFEKREVDKEYLALVNGKILDDSGTIDQPIAPNPAKPGKMMISKKGKPAISHFEVVERFNRATLVKVKIETGRTHQVRLHMAIIGHSLLVDPDYGMQSEFMLSSIKRNYRQKQWENESPIISRLSLHSSKLVLKHPASGEELVVEAPLPKDMEVVLKQMRKYDAIPA